MKIFKSLWDIVLDIRELKPRITKEHLFSKKHRRNKSIKNVRIQIIIKPFIRTKYSNTKNKVKINQLSKRIYLI